MASEESPHTDSPRRVEQQSDLAGNLRATGDLTGDPGLHVIHNQGCVFRRNNFLKRLREGESLKFQHVCAAFKFDDL